MRSPRTLIRPALAASLAMAAALAASATSLPASATPSGPGQWLAMGTGFNNNVRSVIVAPDGTLYAGGDFTTASGISAARIVSWVDDTWVPLGSGVNQAVYAVTVAPDGSLYASGGFTTAGGGSARNVARWDGTAWSALSTGLTGNVAVALALSDDSVLFAGQFGGVSNPSNGLAVWNGSAFSGSLGGLAWDTAYAAGQTTNGDIYVGGDMATVGGVPVTKVAQWHDDTWTDMGGGVENEIYAMATRGADTVFVGGYLLSAGGPSQTDVTLNRVGLWQDDTWHALGFGLGSSPVQPYVKSLAYDDTHALLYASGLFGYACGTPACLVTDDTVPLGNIGVWDVTAQRWRPLAAANGQGLAGGVVPVGESVATSPDGATVYVGGDFTSAGGVSGTNRMARWVWSEPDLIAITPTSGPSAGGTTVTIDGSNFIGVSRVLVNSASATFTWLDDSTISVTMPPGSGTATVSVEAVGGTTPTPATYTYVTPVPPVLPGPPTDVQAIAGDRTASVSWQPPAASGSYAVSDYRVTASPGGQSCTTSGLACDVAGLANGTTYTFVVEALSGAGWGTPSAPSNAVTPQGAPPRDMSIQIAGSRAGKDVTITGSSTGFGMGALVTPWTKKAGSGQPYAAGRDVLVALDGTFTWSRKANASIWVYVTGGGVRSNYVKLPAA